MNLFFRMLWVWCLSLRRERLPVGRAESRLSLVTLPNDLDLNLHMNNGRYLTICDLSRIDLFIRTGLVTAMRRHGWAPIVTEHTMTYRKPLRLFQRYDVVMELADWDDTSFKMKHRFESRGRIVAEGTSSGVLRARDGVVPTATVLETLHAMRRKA